MTNAPALRSRVGRVLRGGVALEALLGTEGRSLRDGTTFGGDEFAGEAVYRGRQTELNRPVAVRCFPATRDLRGGRLEHCLKQARNGATVSHPGVARTHDVGIDDEGYAFIVLEWLDGHSLDRELRGSMLTKDALQVGIEVLEALGAAHARGVSHRDLRPALVMLCGEGAEGSTARIIGFGLRALRNEQEPQGWISSSGAIALDVRAAAAIVYRALGGGPIWEAPLPPDAWLQSLPTPLPALPLRPDLPDEESERLLSVLERAMLCTEQEASSGACDALLSELQGCAQRVARDLSGRRRVGTTSSIVQTLTADRSHGQSLRLIGWDGPSSEWIADRTPTPAARQLQARVMSQIRQGGGGSITLVSGRIGSGRTSLAKEVIGRLSRRAGAISGIGRCAAQQNGLLAALDSLLATEGLDGEALDRGLKAALRPLESERPDYRQQLATLLRKGPPSESDHSAPLKEMERLLRRCTALGPTVLVIDDFHDADSLTTDFVLHMADSLLLRPAPIHVVLLASQELLPRHNEVRLAVAELLLIGPPLVRSQELGLWADSDISDLLQRQGGLAPHAGDEIATHVAGNPLHAQLLLKALSTSNGLRHGLDGKELLSVTSLSSLMPEARSAEVVRYCERMVHGLEQPEISVSLLKLASLLPQPFNEEQLTELGEDVGLDGAATAAAHISAWFERGLVVGGDGQNRSASFVSPLVRDGLAVSIGTDPAKKQAYEKAADQFSDSVSASLADLADHAWHWRQAGKREREVETLLKMTKVARRRRRPRLAMRSASAAAERSGTSPPGRRHHVACVSAAQLAAQLGYRDDVNRFADLGKKSTQPAVRLRALLTQLEFYARVSSGEGERGPALLEETRQAADETPEDHGMQERFRAAEVLYCRRLRQDDLLPLATALTESAKAPSNIARGWMGVAAHLRLRGDYEQANEPARKAVELLRAQGNSLELVEAQIQLAIIRSFLGDMEQAWSILKEARSLAERRGMMLLVGQSYLLALRLQLGVGALDEGQRSIERALELFEYQRDRKTIIWLLNAMGEVKRKQGALAEGLAYYERSLEGFRELGRMGPAANVLGNIGATHILLGNHEKADRLLQDAYDLLQELPARDGLMIVCLLRAECAIHLNQDRELIGSRLDVAFSMLKQARDYRDEDTAMTMKRLGVLLHAKNMPARGSILLDRSEDIFESLGHERELIALRQARRDITAKLEKGTG